MVEAYPYIEHLVELEWRAGTTSVPVWLQGVATPLIWRAWNWELRNRPDLVFRNYVLNGIWNGFHIGFDRGTDCTPATSNMRSALDNAAVVQEYLNKEVSLGHMIGPVSPEMMPIGTQISPFGVIPKSSQPGKWRLIVNLSSPDGRSVKSGINTELFSLSYLHLDQVTDHILKKGRGTKLAKMDIASAYHIVPVHSGDRPLLAVQWAGNIFFDTRLPLAFHPNFLPRWQVHCNGSSRSGE